MLADYCDGLLLRCTLQLNNAVCFSGCPAGDDGDDFGGLTSWGFAGTQGAASSMPGLDMHCSASTGPGTTPEAALIAEPCARGPATSVQDLPASTPCEPSCLQHTAWFAMVSDFPRSAYLCCGCCKCLLATVMYRCWGVHCS